MEIGSCFKKKKVNKQDNSIKEVEVKEGTAHVSSNTWEKEVDEFKEKEYEIERIECLICFEDIHKERSLPYSSFQFLRCKHEFCVKCIYQWIMVEGKLTYSCCRDKLCKGDCWRLGKLHEIAKYKELDSENWIFKVIILKSMIFFIHII